ncbi:hypothetical protein ACU8DI_08460 [Psychroserpens sp. BH13MA-6]
MKTFKGYTLITLLCIMICTGCAKSASEQVEDTCLRFLKGRIDLRSNDSLQLKAVTSDSLYELFMLHHSYEQLLDAPIVRADLNLSVKSVKIQEDCATCEMNGPDYYTIQVCKDDEGWKVQGENNMYPNAERIAIAKAKIATYKEQLKLKPLRDSLLLLVNKFHPRVKEYFTNKDLEPLRPICDEATLNFIQKFYAYTKERTGLDVIHEEMKKPDFLVGDYYNDNGYTEFKYYNEDITLVLSKDSDHNFVISGFNGLKSDVIDDAIMKGQYLDLLRALKLIRKPQYRNNDIR